MNRPRKTDRHLPRNVYFRHGAYYLVRQGKWVRLGTDLAVALHQYGLTTNQKSGGMPKLIDDVLLHIKPGLSKATNTQYRLAGEVLKRKLAEKFLMFSMPEDPHGCWVGCRVLDRVGDGSQTISGGDFGGLRVGYGRSGTPNADR